jgi:hypothetical protein
LPHYLLKQDHQDRAQEMEVTEAMVGGSVRGVVFVACTLAATSAARVR